MPEVIHPGIVLKLRRKLGSIHATAHAFAAYVNHTVSRRIYKCLDPSNSDLLFLKVDLRKKRKEAE